MRPPPELVAGEVLVVEVFQLFRVLGLPPPDLIESVVLGVAAVLVGCSSKAAPPSNLKLDKHAPGIKRDVRILNGLLDTEHKAIAAYTASIPLLPQPASESSSSSQSHTTTTTTTRRQKKSDENPPLELLNPLASAAAAQFLSQELAHVTELKGLIKQAGGTPARPAPSYELGHPKTKEDVLMLLHGVEQAQMTAYLHAITVLTPGRLRGAAAAILANHAQQASVLRLDLGLRPVPSALVTGRE